MNKKSQAFWIVCAVLFSLNIGFYAGQKMRQRQPQLKLLRSEQNKINETLELVNLHYVDSVDLKFLSESAVGKIISELDPHSSYIPASDVETVNEDLESSFSGIGIQFNNITDTIIVTSIFSGGPAEKAGLRPFDRILTVNDSVVAGKNYGSNKLVRMLRGPKNSKVMLGIQRGKADQLLSFELVRGDIPNKSIDVSYKVSANVGYIKVSKFARSTYSELLTAIAKLRQEGVSGLVIDLRENPGGYMEAAYLMVNEFLSKGSMMVYTQGKAYPRTDFRATGKGTCKDVPLVVLIDELSGSASEIFAGAIQDNDRGLIIGRRSYGKGLVQTKLDLSDRSALLLTIQRYYTPSGRCIQKDYQLGKSQEYSMEILNRLRHGEHFTADSIKLNESLVYHTIGGRTVYGGGGIMPDIFVPYDTTGNTSYLSQLYETGILYQFTIEYSDRNQDKLKSFNDDKALHEYLKQQPLISELAEYASSKGVRKRPTLMDISQKLIETELYAYIVRNFFSEGYYKVKMQDDHSLKKAIEVIEKGVWKPVEGGEKSEGGFEVEVIETDAWKPV